MYSVFDIFTMWKSNILQNGFSFLITHELTNTGLSILNPTVFCAGSWLIEFLECSDTFTVDLLFVGVQTLQDLITKVDVYQILQDLEECDFNNKI